MKILIIGTGVIGSVYGWQLSLVQHTVTHLVRPGTVGLARQDGLLIRGVDLRRNPPIQLDIHYSPSVVEEIDPAAGYDLIVVPVQRTQLAGVLPLLARQAGQSDILFFQNLWTTAEIERQLKPEQVLFGFPRLVTGCKTGSLIQTTIYSSSAQQTVLGERDGQVSHRLERIKTALQQADLRPQLVPQILGWLAAHYVEWIGPVGGMLKAGSIPAFARDKALIRESILATQEGLSVCQKRGFDDKKAYPDNLKLFNTLPMFALTSLAGMQYKMAEIQQLFEGHLTYGLAEIKAQYHDVIDEAHRLNLPVPTLDSYRQVYD